MIAQSLWLMALLLAATQPLFRLIFSQSFRVVINRWGQSPVEPFKIAHQPALVFAAILNSRCQLVTDEIIAEKAWEMGELPSHDTIYGNVKRINRFFTQHGLPEVIRILKHTGYELIRN